MARPNKRGSFHAEKGMQFESITSCTRGGRREPNSSSGMHFKIIESVLDLVLWGLFTVRTAVVEAEEIISIPHTAAVDKLFTFLGLHVVEISPHEPITRTRNFCLPAKIYFSHPKIETRNERISYVECLLDSSPSNISHANYRIYQRWNTWFVKGLLSPALVACILAVLESGKIIGVSLASPVSKFRTFSCLRVKVISLQSTLAGSHFFRKLAHCNMWVYVS